MKNIILFVLLICFSSCEKDDTEVQYQTDELIGYYKFVSFTSDVAMDLNLDSNVTTNFLQEFSDYYYQNPYYISNQLRVKKSGLGVFILETIFPKANIYPEYAIYDVSYTTSIQDAYIKYYKKYNSLEYELTSSEDYQHQLGFHTIKSIRILPDMKIEVKAKHKYYQHPSGWQDVNITCIYERYRIN